MTDASPPPINASQSSSSSSHSNNNAFLPENLRSGVEALDPLPLPSTAEGDESSASPHPEMLSCSLPFLPVLRRMTTPSGDLLDASLTSISTIASTGSDRPPRRKTSAVVVVSDPPRREGRGRRRSEDAHPPAVHHKRSSSVTDDWKNSLRSDLQPWGSHEYQNQQASSVLTGTLFLLKANLFVVDSIVCGQSSMIEQEEGSPHYRSNI